MHLILVFIIIGITIANLFSLKYATTLGNDMQWLVYAIFLGVLLTNILKFIVWGAIHKRFNLNISYSLLSLYFPIIYAVTVIGSDMTLSISKVVAICFICTGCLLIQIRF